MTDDMREKRIDDEVRSIMSLPAKRRDEMLRLLVGSVWSAVDDLSDVPERLHPCDVVEKYIQRGNIIRDGQW